jgi:hypothetical protein
MVSKSSKLRDPPGSFPAFFPVPGVRAVPCTRITTGGVSETAAQADDGAGDTGAAKESRDSDRQRDVVELETTTADGGPSTHRSTNQACSILDAKLHSRSTLYCVLLMLYMALRLLADVVDGRILHGTLKTGRKRTRCCLSSSPCQSIGKCVKPGSGKVSDPRGDHMNEDDAVL